MPSSVSVLYRIVGPIPSLESARSMTGVTVSPEDVRTRTLLDIPGEGLLVDPSAPNGLALMVASGEPPEAVGSRFAAFLGPVQQSSGALFRASLEGQPTRLITPGSREIRLFAPTTPQPTNQADGRLTRQLATAWISNSNPEIDTSLPKLQRIHHIEGMPTGSFDRLAKTLIILLQDLLTKGKKD